MNNLIALFIPTLTGGGAERSMLYLANQLVDLGYQVDLVVAKCVGELQGAVSPRVNTVHLDAKKVLFSVSRLKRYIESRRPKILMSAVENANLVSVASNLIVRGSRPKLILHIDNALWSTGKGVRLVKRVPWILISALAFPLADYIVPVSEGLSSQVKSLPFVKAAKVGVIYNPVINADFHPSGVALSDGQPEERFVVAAGRLEPQKGYEDLLHAFARVRLEHEAKLVILGEGGQRSKLESLIGTLNLAGSVELLGFQTNPLPFFRQSSIFVLASHWEGFGNVLVEALACGTRVISTDCQYGPREILAGGKYGILVDVGNVRQLAGAICAALEDPNVGRANDEELGVHLAQFTVENSAAAFASLFEAMVGRGISATGYRQAGGER